MNDATMDMWEYWRDKYGALDAVKEQYPATLKGDVLLSVAVAQIELGTLALEARMQQLVSGSAG